MADIDGSARTAGPLIDLIWQRRCATVPSGFTEPEGQWQRGIPDLLNPRRSASAISCNKRHRVTDIIGIRHSNLWTCLKRGFRRLCPRCGEATMFAGYLTVAVRCSACGLEFDPIRADDAPAYFTLSVVGHIVVSGLLLMEATLHPPSWLQAAIWLPATLFLSLALLPFMKGGVMAAIYCSRRKHHTI